MKAIRIYLIMTVIIFQNIFTWTQSSETIFSHTSMMTTFTYGLELDGASFDLILPVEVTPFVSSLPDEVMQIATSFNPLDYLEISIITIPDSSEQLIARVFGSDISKSGDYLKILQNFRDVQGATQLQTQQITMFGQRIDGISNKVMLNVANGELSPIVINEWVINKFGHIWLLRISQLESGYNTNPILYNEIEILERDFTQPSINLPTLSAPPKMLESQIVFKANDLLSDLPAPSWWNGDCDVNNFPGSYPLGPSYRGVKACGPLNTAREVNFGVGVHQYEWQCPELSKRYLYLAFGTAPYSAHGKDVVWNYPNPNLEKVTNGTANKGPNAGDVLSYGATDQYGHTSVVTTSSIDANGNGTVTVMEQNWTAPGTRTHTVSGWVVQASMAVSGWLHIPSGSCNNPSPNADQIGLYTGQNYCGTAKIFGIGEWANPGAMGFPNDSATSIKVGANVKAILCRDDNYAGGCEEFTGNDSDLTNNSIGTSTSSLKVQSRGSSTGTWTANYYDTIDRWWDNNNGNNFRCSENVGGPYLDKNYGASGPCGMDGDTWIGDYSATINFASGNYVFLIDHDDGAKLWLNGSNIADYGGSGSTTALCPARYLSGNTNLRAMLREDGGDARIKVSWTTDASVCMPAAPSNLRTTSTTQNSITFAWNDNSSNENGFRIYKWNGSDWQNINSVNSNTTSYTDTSLSCGSTYYYDVSAYNDYGEAINSGDYLTAQTGACPTAPSTPGNFRITGTTQTTMTMAWDDVSNETGYKIYKWNGSGFLLYSTLGSNVTNFTDTSLPCDADQFYEVSAYNTIGESSHASWIVGRTTNCTAACSPAQNISLGSYDIRRNDSTGSSNLIIKYGNVAWTETGPEFTYTLDLDENKLVVVQLSGMDADLDIFVLSGSSGQCHSSNLVAYGDTYATFQGIAGQRYYLIVDGYHGAVGNYRIDVGGNSSVYLPIIIK